MLTEEQIKKLESLCQHVRYGKILQDAIETWKNSQPCQKIFGVYVYYENKTHFEMSANKCCCLIGAAGYTKKPFHSLLKTIVLEYALNDIEEVWAISDGFDGNKLESQVYKEAYVFGSSVREIVEPTFLDV